MSLVQILSIHLVQVGQGSLSREDRKAPHFRPPTPGHNLNTLDIIKERKSTQMKKVEETPIHPPKRKQRCRRRAGPHGKRGLHSKVVEQRMTVEPLCWGGGGGVSHPLQLTTGLVVNNFITNPHLGRSVYTSYSEGMYAVGTNKIFQSNYIKTLSI